MSAVSKEEIAQFLKDTLLEGRDVSFDEDLLLTGLLDSLGVMTLIAHLEDTTGARIPAGDITIENFSSIDVIVAYLNGQ